MDQPQDGWREQFGYSPHRTLEEEGLVGPNVRMSAIQDPGALIVGLVEAMARRSAQGEGTVLRWQPRGDRFEEAALTPGDVAHWVDTLQLDPMSRNAVIEEVSTPQGIRVVGDGLVLAGIADQAEMRGNALVLTRGRRI
jgi:hypothetical protein